MEAASLRGDGGPAGPDEVARREDEGEAEVPHARLVDGAREMARRRVFIALHAGEAICSRSEGAAEWSAPSRIASECLLLRRGVT